MGGKGGGQGDFGFAILEGICLWDTEGWVNLGGVVGG